MLDLDAIKMRWEPYGTDRLSLTTNLHLSTDLHGPGDTFVRVEMPSHDEDAILHDMAYAPADIAALITEVERLQALEQATNREKAQAHYYQQYARALMAGYMKLFPTDAYIEESAMGRIVDTAFTLQKEAERLQRIEAAARAMLELWDDHGSEERATLRRLLDEGEATDDADDQPR